MQFNDHDLSDGTPIRFGLEGLGKYYYSSGNTWIMSFLSKIFEGNKNKKSDINSIQIAFDPDLKDKFKIEDFGPLYKMVNENGIQYDKQVVGKKIIFNSDLKGSYEIIRRILIRELKVVLSEENLKGLQLVEHYGGIMMYDLEK